MDTVDLELDRLLSKRASQDHVEDPDEQEERWKASVRAHNARRREQLQAEWREYHQGQAACLRRTLEALIAHHETQAKKLLEDQPKGAT